MKQLLKKYSLFIFLFPIFFVLHGFANNFEFVPAKAAIILTFKYLLASVVLYSGCRLLLKNKIKASLATLILLSYNFFFGNIYDFFKTIAPNSFLVKYSFILPFSAVMLILFFIVLKKTTTNLIRAQLFLNYLFLLLIAIDLGTLFTNLTKNKNKNKIVQINKLIPCDTCRKPDIYLIVTDEYAGSKTLTNIFQFDNSTFEINLKKRGFHIIEASTSNYNFSPFSIASMLNMDYLENLQGSNTSSNDMDICYNTIKENKVLHFFNQLGYSIYNCSIFDVADQKSITKSTVLSNTITPLVSQTFTYRIYKQLGYHLAASLRVKFAIEDIVYTKLYDNEKLYALTLQTAKLKSKQPKFVYTHLLMPHYPYYFNSKGTPTPIKKLTESYYSDKRGYTEYLEYTNGKLLELIDHIQLHSSTPPIIILMGDHGFRQYNSNVDKKYNFLNLNALLFTDRNYNTFYPGMSNINQFRLILNSQFGQHLPLLRDSTSYLRP